MVLRHTFHLTLGGTKTCSANKGSSMNFHSNSAFIIGTTPLEAPYFRGGQRLAVQIMAALYDFFLIAAPPCRALRILWCHFAKCFRKEEKSIIKKRTKVLQATRSASNCHRAPNFFAWQQQMFYVCTLQSGVPSPQG